MKACSPFRPLPLSPFLPLPLSPFLPLPLSPALSIVHTSIRNMLLGCGPGFFVEDAHDLADL